MKIVPLTLIQIDTITKETMT